MEAAMTRKSEAGNVLIFTVLALTVLMGFAGFAVDMGIMRHEKRLQQTAADAAAIAGANNLGFGGVQVGAQSAASANGFTDGSGNDVTQCTSVPSSTVVQTQQVCVEVYDGPAYLASIGQTDPHNGDANYVEAVVATVQPTYFMRIVGINSEVVVARAVATNVSGGSNDACMVTLGPYNSSGIEGINLTGSPTLNAQSCGIVDDGNWDPTGGSSQLIVKAASFSVSGPVRPGGNVTCYPAGQPCPAFNAPAASDPFNYLTAPGRPAASSSCPAKGSCDVSTSGTENLQPGTYSSITFGKNSTTTLSPGIYYIDGTGGVSFNGGGTVTGDGVMFYFTCPPGTSPCTNGATLNAVGGGNLPDINLTAPDSTNCPSCASEYDGILMYQDPNDTNAPSLGGDDNSSWAGALYFPSVELSFYGNAKGNGYTVAVVVAKALAMTGNPTVTLTGTPGLPSGVDLIKNAVLVE
jgi:Flp pilus assembly protein TadG